MIAMLNPIRLHTDLLTNTDKTFLTGSAPEIRSEHPMLGWEVSSDQDKVLQTSYRILVATSPTKLKVDKADIWDSGVVQSDNCTAVRMGGPALSPNTKYWWTVQITDNLGNTSKWAMMRSFKTAAVLDGAQSRYAVQKNLQYPASTSVKGNVYLADFGKDAYSQINITFASKCDTTVTVWLGEKLLDGAVDKKPGGTIRCCSYELKVGKGLHDYKIDITPDKRNSTIVEGRSYNPVLVAEHLKGDIYPFRYCEVDGVCDDVKIVKASRHAVFYPFDDKDSSFKSSDATLNAVWDLCKYTMKATSALGVFIDGDRERIPYEADALINQLSWYSSVNDYSIARYTIDYLCRNATWPTEWILQACLMVWHDYMYTGNTTLIERNYDILKARTLSALRDERGLISTRTGKQTPALMKSIGYAGDEVKDIVDWPQSGALGVGKEEAGEADAYVFTDYNTVVNAFHYKSLMVMKELAKAIGKDQDAEAFGKDAALTLESFNDVFWGGKAYKDGADTDHCSLHASMIPLAFGMVPEGRKSSVVDYIRSRGMACSVYGAQFLLEGLYGAGADEYALSLMTSKSIRSWYHMIELGSTMTLEAWDIKFKPNLDWNHAWGAAPANIIQRSLMGIEPIEPGFRRFSVCPKLGNLNYAEITVPTIRGEITCKCTRNASGRIDMLLTVPANCEAEIQFPDGSHATAGSGKISISR